IEQIVDRLEGVRAHGALEAPQKAMVVAAPPAPPPPPVAAGPSPWVWALGGVSTASFVTAVVLAARAASVDPGDEATTSAMVGIDDLQRDAAEAHRLAIGADVLVAFAAAGAVATIVVAVVPRDDRPAELLLAPTG